MEKKNNNNKKQLRNKSSITYLGLGTITNAYTAYEGIKCY